MASSDLEGKDVWGETDGIDAEIMALTTEQISQRTRMLTNNARVSRSDIQSLDQQIKEREAMIKDNTEKIKVNKQLPYLVSNVVEVRLHNP